MKSVVIEIKDDFAAILSDDGCITKVKNHNYSVGQVIELKKNTIFKTKKFAACAAAAVIVLFGLGGGVYTYASPYSYVSLDVNPSIEFTLNRFDRVLSVKAVNDDGEEILKEVRLNDLENQTITQALTATVGQIAEEGYFDETAEGGLVITTAGENNEKSEKMAEELKESVENTLEETDKVVEVEAISVGLERVKEATELGVTPGKLNLVQKLIASSEEPGSIVLEEWLNKPVKDIMGAIKANKKAAKTVTSPETDSTPEAAIISEKTGSADVSDKTEKAAKQKSAKNKKKADINVEKEASKPVKEREKAATASSKETSRSKVNKETEKSNETPVKEAKKPKEAANKKAEKATVAENKEAEKTKEAADKAKEAADKEAEKTKETAKKVNGKQDKSSAFSKSDNGDTGQKVSDKNSSSKEDKKSKEDSKSFTTPKSDKSDSKSDGKSNQSKGN